MTVEIYRTTYSAFTPVYLEWFLDARDNCPSGARSMANMNVMMSAATLMEGTLEYVFRRQIRRELKIGAVAVIPDDTPSNRALIQLDEDIRRTSGWDGYKKMHKRLFGTPFENNDLHQAVAILFKLRGAVIGHGRAVNSIGPTGGSTEKSTDEFEWESTVFRDVESFLVQGDLLEKQTSGFPEPGRWFSDEIADYFYKSAIEFLVELGIREDVDANLLWYDDAPRTRMIVENRLGGRPCPQNR